MDQNNPVHRRAHRVLDQHLTAKHMRHTPERREVLDAVLDSRGTFTADQLTEAVEARGNMRLSRQTVYSALEVLAACSLVRRRVFGGRAACYEATPTTVARQQMQLVCSRCGKVKALKSPVDLSELTSRRYSGFHADHADIVIHGICTSCLRKR